MFDILILILSGLNHKFVTIVSTMRGRDGI